MKTMMEVQKMLVFYFCIRGCAIKTCLLITTVPDCSDYLVKHNFVAVDPYFSSCLYKWQHVTLSSRCNRDPEPSASRPHAIDLCGRRPFDCQCELCSKMQFLTSVAWNISPTKGDGEENELRIGKQIASFVLPTLMRSHQAGAEVCNEVLIVSDRKRIM
jgi:hypothetical protein